MNRAQFLRQGLVSFLLVLAPVLRAAGDYVPFRPDLQAGTACRIDARQLHPTQFALGFREVAAKTAAIEAMDAGTLIPYLQEKDVPIVIGPAGVPYMVDGHHTIRALLDSRQPDKTVYGHILANWSALDTPAFWARMRESHYAYLKDKDGRPGEPGALPATLLQMQSDSYRGLCWAVLVAGGFQQLKGTGALFQEFFWADYFRPRVRWNDEDEADFQRALQEALALAHDPAAATLPGYLPAK